MKLQHLSLTAGLASLAVATPLMQLALRVTNSETLQRGAHLGKPSAKEGMVLVMKTPITASPGKNELVKIQGDSSYGLCIGFCVPAGTTFTCQRGMVSTDFLWRDSWTLTIVRYLSTEKSVIELCLGEPSHSIDLYWRLSCLIKGCRTCCLVVDKQTLVSTTKTSITAGPKNKGLVKIYDDEKPPPAYGLCMPVCIPDRIPYKCFGGTVSEACPDWSHGADFSVVGPIHPRCM